MLIDSHCHIHDSQFFTSEARAEAYQAALKAGVGHMLLVGTSLDDSKAALTFARKHPEHLRASIGIHPHEATKYTPKQLEDQLAGLEILVTDPLATAIGECGFDFYYNDKKSALSAQEALLRGQLEIAAKHTKPVSFHVREAFDEFWRVLADYPTITGVLHSFTDSPDNLQKALAHGLYIGVNGIATFTTHTWQRELFKTLPLEKIILETDSPFLTPKPKRGTINEPKNVTYITDFLAELRGEDDKRISDATTVNARTLFGF